MKFLTCSGQRRFLAEGLRRVASGQQPRYIGHPFHLLTQAIQGCGMTEKPVSEMNYEEAMAALEAVVARLEQGDVALEDSIALYERGAALKAHCAARLAEAEARVEQIRIAEGKVVGTAPAEGI